MANGITLKNALRPLKASMQGQKARAKQGGRAQECHIPIIVSTIMAGGGENVHLNEVVLQSL